MNAAGTWKTCFAEGQDALSLKVSHKKQSRVSQALQKTGKRAWTVSEAGSLTKANQRHSEAPAPTTRYRPEERPAAGPAAQRGAEHTAAPRGRAPGGLPRAQRPARPRPAHQGRAPHRAASGTGPPRLPGAPLRAPPKRPGAVPATVAAGGAGCPVPGRSSSLRTPPSPLRSCRPRAHGPQRRGLAPSPARAPPPPRMAAEPRPSHRPRRGPANSAPRSERGPARRLKPRAAPLPLRGCWPMGASRGLAVHSGGCSPDWPAPQRGSARGSAGGAGSQTQLCKRKVTVWIFVVVVDVFFFLESHRQNYIFFFFTVTQKHMHALSEIGATTLAWGFLLVFSKRIKWF